MIQDKVILYVSPQQQCFFSQCKEKSTTQDLRYRQLCLVLHSILNIFYTFDV